MNFLKMPVWFTCISLGMFLCVAYGGAPQDALENGKAIQVQVEMVSMPVVVTSRDGKRITDLQRDDFQVYEDKNVQEIAGFATTEEPISVALLLDTSGSMQYKMRLLQDEAVRFTNMLNPRDKVAVLSFADDSTLLQEFTTDRARIESSIRRTSAGGATSLYEAVSLALDQVLKPVHERKAIVLFTDGIDTASRGATRKGTLRAARECDATIYSIFFNTENDFAQGSPQWPGRGSYPFPIVLTGTSMDYFEGKKYLREIARDSGGLFYDALTTTDLGPAFEEIAHELGSQYSLGYYPSNPKHDGRFHNIQVKVNRSGAVVRTKKGYVLPR